MALSNYTELQAAVAGYINRSDAGAAFVDFIALAEADMNRRLRCPENETSNTAFAITSRYTALPTAFAEMRRVVLTATPREELMPLSPSLSGGFFESGRPIYYAITGNQLEVVPFGSYELELFYWRDVPALVSNSTNDVLTKYPDLYLFGSCAQAGIWLDDPGLTSRFMPMYEQALNFANTKAQRQLGSGLTIRCA